MTTTPTPTITVLTPTGDETGPFSTVWPYVSPDDVWVFIETGGVPGPDLVENVDYTLTSAGPEATGGEVTLTPAAVPAGGWVADGPGATRLILRRWTARRQSTALPDAEGHKPRATERALDRAMRIAEEISDEQDLAIKVAPGQTPPTAKEVMLAANAAESIGEALAKSEEALAGVEDKATRDGDNLTRADTAGFNARLEQYRLPFDKPLMDFVTDIDAPDWKPFFDAAVDWAAANAPSGVRFILPRFVVAGGIPLSWVKPILSDNVSFVSKGRAIWTGAYEIATDRCDIRLLPSGSNSVFKWGANAFDPSVPGGFTQRGGGLEGLNIRGWLSTAWVIDCHGVANPQFKSIWLWVPFNAMSIRNGLDPELTDIHVEAYRNTGIVLNGTGEGGGADPRAGRGDRGFAYDVVIVGAGDEAGPTSPNPAFAVRGYWHTFDCTGVRIVKGGGAQALWVGDRRNGDANQRPHFITFNNTQIDYVRSRSIEIDDADGVWFNGALYLNSSTLEHIKIGANARDVSIEKPRGYASKSRMITVGGVSVRIEGGTCKRWNSDGTSSEPCIYMEPTATDLRIDGVSFGDPLSVDSSAGKLAVYAPPEAGGALSMVGCSFSKLATLPVAIGGTRFNSAGCVDEFGPAKLPMGAFKLFLGAQDYLSGSHALYAVGDMAMAYAGAAAFFNSYYDGAAFRRASTGAAAYLKNEEAGLAVYQAGTGAAGSAFSANVVARFNIDGSMRVQTRLGVGRDAVAGSSVMATAGDIAIGGAVPSVCFNLYFDNGWKYMGNGPGLVIRAVLNGATPRLQLQSAPNNTGGPGAAAAMTVVGHVATN
ncbi:hypothetical protein [Brevundimonas sp.]|uniref:hypothetical protein n=1 Tax=Brevundimonas sp. TaxID=1871086 RepID=UPI00289C45D4|nr:hypothetical protein [Brevundimonas sp.]